MSRSEEPMDFEAVAADDALVERLRSALPPLDAPQDAVVWDDDEDDLSYALLRSLQRDVSAGIENRVPAVVPLARPRRGFGRSTTVAAVAAGVLSLAGAAAAATSAPGDAMYGVRSAVAEAVHDALDAITPSQPIGPSLPAPVAATPTVTISPRGAEVSAKARSVSAARQIEERIDTADRLLDRGRVTAAGQVLDQAERRLPLVLDAALRAAYQKQIDALRARALLLSTPTQTRGPSARPDPDRGKSVEEKATPRPTRSASATRGSAAEDDVDRPGRGAGKVGLPTRPSLPAPAASAQNR